MSNAQVKGERNYGTYLYYTDAFGFCQDILERSIKCGTLLI